MEGKNFKISKKNWIFLFLENTCKILYYLHTPIASVFKRICICVRIVLGFPIHGNILAIGFMSESKCDLRKPCLLLHTTWKENLLWLLYGQVVVVFSCMNLVIWLHAGWCCYCLV